MQLRANACSWQAAVLLRAQREASEAAGAAGAAHGATRGAAEEQHEAAETAGNGKGDSAASPLSLRFRCVPTVPAAWFCLCVSFGDDSALGSHTSLKARGGREILTGVL